MSSDSPLLGPTPTNINRLEPEGDGEPAVLYNVDDHGVCIITLNMSRQMNGWGPALSSGWLDAYDRAQADDTVKVIVVTGRGRAWCAGAAMDGLQDLGASGGMDSGGRGAAKKKVESTDEKDPAALPKEPNGFGGVSDTDTNQVIVDHKGRPINHALWITKPIIAAINGACAGGGMGQAMNCDMRFAAEGATFSTAFARRGLIAEWGISWALPRVVGTGNAMDLLLSARKFKGVEAKELGVVQRVFPAESLLEETVAYARDMADNGAKRLIVCTFHMKTNDLPRQARDNYEQNLNGRLSYTQSPPRRSR